MSSARVRKITTLALFVTLALIVSLIENMITPLFPFLPGAKIGLTNIVTLFVLVIYGFKEAGIVLLIRIIFNLIFSGNVVALCYSLSGGILSLTVSFLLYRFCFPKISLISISFFAAVTHNIAQIIVAILIVNTFNLIYYLPYLLIIGGLSGILIGIIIQILIINLPYGLLKKMNDKLF